MQGGRAHFFSLHVAIAWLGLVFFRQVLESDPAFTFLNIFELLHDLLFRVSRRLNNSPECDEFIQADLSIIVLVNLREEFIGRNPSERGLPVIQGFSFIDCITAIDIKNAKDFLHSLLACGRELLEFYRGQKIIKERS